VPFADAQGKRLRLTGCCDDAEPGGGIGQNGTQPRSKKQSSYVVPFFDLWYFVTFVVA
jgi:hypothetical protein